MQDNLVITLLHKQLTDQLNSADKQLLLDWLANSDGNVAVQEEVAQVWDLSKNYQPAFVPNVDASFEKFSKRISQKIVEPTPKVDAKTITLNPIRTWMKYAAVAVVLLGSVAVWQITQGGSVENLMVSTINNEIKKVELTDGSFVGLNEKSSLNYPDKFTGDTREVVLEGTAFFDIAEDADNPFIIKGGDADVRVVGTSFSFTTDNGDGIMVVEVKDGIVDLIPTGSSKSTTLTKNQRGFYDKKNKTFLPTEIVKNTNADYFLTNKYSFQDDKYSYVFNILGNQYDVDFKFQSEDLKDCTLTSPVPFEDKTLDEILPILEAVYEARNLSFEKMDDGSYLIDADTCE